MENKYNAKTALKAFNFEYEIQRLDVRTNHEVENRREDWISWDARNDYPQFLLQVKENSPTLSVCIDAKTNLTLGDGVEIEGMGNVMVNKYETLTELYYKLVYDLWVFGGWAVEIIPDRTGTKIESIYHLPFQNVRVGKKDEDDHLRDIDYYYYSEDWSQYRKKITKFHSLDLGRREGRQIFYWTNYSPSTNKVYPITTYQAGINAAVLEAEIMDFHKRNLASSLLPNLHIGLIGDPTPEEKEEIYNELIRTYQGKMGQKLMLSFSISAEERPEITAIANNANDGVYIEVLNLAAQQILSSNQIPSPLLIGIHTFASNPFSQNSNEIVVATKHLLEYSIIPVIKKFNMGLEQVLALKFNQPVKIINKYRIPQLDAL
jgi:hypothetical protein